MLILCLWNSLVEIRVNTENVVTSIDELVEELIYLLLYELLSSNSSLTQIAKKN